MDAENYGYIAPGTNVFCANEIDKKHLSNELEVGKWYYAEVTWKTFIGPFHSKEEANGNFQAYVAKVSFSCPSCED